MPPRKKKTDDSNPAPQPTLTYEEKEDIIAYITRVQTWVDEHGGYFPMAAYETAMEEFLAHKATQQANKQTAAQEAAEQRAREKTQTKNQVRTIKALPTAHTDDLPDWAQRLRGKD